MSPTIRKLFAKVLTAGACALSLAAPPAADAAGAPPAVKAAAPADRPMTSKELHQHLARSSGWIQNAANRSSGTGWILDAGKKLMVTNAHVVEGADAVEVVFPQWKDGKLVREESAYDRAPRVRATVIDRDENRDLALLRLESIPAGMRALSLAESEPDEGDDIRTIGASTRGGDGLVWGAVAGVVRTVGPQHGAAGAGPVRHVLSDSGTNSGNSGAPVVNMAGELVGVHVASKLDARNVAMHISVVELRSFLKESVPLADPKTATQFLARGKRRLASGRPDAAATDFSAALAKDGGLSEALYLRGRAFLAKNDPRTALEDFDAALAVEPNRYDYRITRGIALRRTGKPEQALADFTVAVRLNPARPDAYNQRGLTHYAAKKFADAEADFTRAIKADAEDPVPYANRADARAALKQYEAAAADWAKAAKLDPRDPTFPNGLGIVLLRMGKVNQAVEAFFTAVEVSGGHPTYLTNLGDALRKAGDSKSAVKAYSEAIKALGGKGPAGLTVDAYTGRGIANRGLKLYRDAVDDFTKAIDLTGGKEAGLFLERALAHIGAGAPAAAEADLAILVKLDPKLAQAIVAAGDPLAGTTWRGAFAKSGVTVTMTYSFNRDGTFQASVTGTNGAKNETMTDSGTYKVANGQLTLNSKVYGTVTRKFTLSGDTAKVTMDEVGLVVTFAKAK